MENDKQYKRLRIVGLLNRLNRGRFNRRRGGGKGLIHIEDNTEEVKPNEFMLVLYLVMKIEACDACNLYAWVRWLGFC